MPPRPNIALEPDATLSAVHAAYVVATGAECSDARTEQTLVRFTTDLNTRLLASSIDVATFWKMLFDAVVEKQALQNACQTALLAAGASELQIDQTSRAVGRLLSECVSAFEKRFPKLIDQLQLRGRPLRARWDTAGPGLLIQIGKQIWNSAPPDDWWPTKVHGALVQPVRGGDGGHATQQNRFWLEAVLTDVDPSVPEIVRVAWLITQIAARRSPTTPENQRQSAVGQGTTNDTALSDPSSLPWRLGTVPIALQAGAELDLIPSPLPIHDAIRLWRLGNESVADVVADWYAQWLETRAPMPVALKALDRMLESVRKPSQPIGFDPTEFDDF